ncbi:SGNH/GDSL hydrolase family protein [Spiroplasma endosymbiont of Panzeria rudis]|uniref:SGNH/GDSL hydrolase family protein n=1 Tax=Spiroplasma endosymbiont of Panzeria rudis TaxID=3066301 RepID=UPI0030CE3D07
MGDSLSDTGALVSGFTALFKHLKIPKIVKMLPPFYKNSFSNGLVAAQIIADYLHINLTSAWRFNLFLFADEQIGNNYAVSGALASRKKELTVESFVINHFDITHQIDALISQHHINSNDIILVEFGGNDILYAFKQSLLKDQEEIINKAVELIKNALTKLINKGAQHILLCNVPNMSIIPLFKNKEKDKERILNLTTNFNKMLDGVIEELNKNKKNIIKYDMFAAITNAINKFKNLNINNNIIDAAVTTDFSEIINNGIIVPHFNKGVNEENINNYFFFDSIHPNKWAHNIIAQELIKLINNNKN